MSHSPVPCVEKPFAALACGVLLLGCHTPPAPTTSPPRVPTVETGKPPAESAAATATVYPTAIRCPLQPQMRVGPPSGMDASEWSQRVLEALEERFGPIEASPSDPTAPPDPETANDWRSKLRFVRSDQPLWGQDEPTPWIPLPGIELVVSSNFAYSTDELSQLFEGTCAPAHERRDLARAAAVLFVLGNAAVLGSTFREGACEVTRLEVEDHFLGELLVRFSDRGEVTGVEYFRSRPSTQPLPCR